jgi:hypothetical protein
MANYSISDQLGGSLQATTATNKTLVALICPASAMRRFKIYDILVGTLGTPADQTYEWEVLKVTADAGTNTSVTPNPLDPADAACVTLGRVNYTVEGTIGAASTAMWYVGTNQRASYRWVAAPGSEIVAPATASNDYALLARSVSGGTVTCTATVLFQEQ